MPTRKQIRMKQLAEKPKIRRRRKPMTEEQKKAAAERLAKARAAKKKTGKTPYGVHPSVMSKPEEDMFSYKNVKSWLAHNKDLAAQERQSVRAKIKGAQGRLGQIEGYVSDIQHYLKTGDWINNFYGKEQGKKIKWKVVAPAYHWYGPYKGMIKRDVGHIYEDVGEWTVEMHNEYYHIQETNTKKRRRKAK